MNRVFGRIAAGVAVSLAIIILPTVGFADAPHCAKLLTKSEVEAAIGEPLAEVSQPVNYAEGHSQCSFHTAEGKMNVMLTFLDLRAIREGMISADSVREFYDMNVRSTEDASGQKGQALKGVGVRAILFTDPEPLRLFVETRKGFAEISGSGVTAKHLEEVGRAVAAP